MEKEIRRINKLIIDKDIELVQVRGTLESQETEIGRLQKPINELQQQENDTKKCKNWRLQLSKARYQITPKKISD